MNDGRRVLIGRTAAASALVAGMVMCACNHRGAAVPTDPSPSPCAQPETAAANRLPALPTHAPDFVIDTHAQTYMIQIWLDHLSPPLNEPTGFLVRVRYHSGSNDISQVEIAVDAEMPHHRHGVMQRPIVEPLGDGFYRVSNLLLHMPGRWEVYFDVTRGGVTERGQWTVTLE